MTFIQKLRSRFPFLAPAPSEIVIQTALYPFELTQGVAEQLTSTIKSQTQLNKVVARAAEGIQERLQDGLSKGIGSWANYNLDSEQALTFAQMIAGSTVLHPCLEQLEPLAGKPLVSLTKALKNISILHGSSSKPTAIFVFESKLSFVFKNDSSLSLDLLNDTTYEKELNFWLGFTNKCVELFLTATVKENVAKIEIQGGAGNWMQFSKSLEQTIELRKQQDK